MPPTSTIRTRLLLRSLAMPASLVAVVSVLALTAAPRSSADDAPKAPETDKPAADAPSKPETPAKPEAPAKPATPDIPDIKDTMWDKLYLDLNGKSTDLADAAGKPMVVELWATWCPPCRKQREHMYALSAEYPDVAFVAASVDKGGGNAVRIYLAEKKPPKTSKVIEVLATPELQAKLNRLNASRSIPKIAYVNSDGQIVEVAVGTQSPEVMKRKLRTLTKAK